MTEQWKLLGKRKKIKLNKHEITVIEAPATRLSLEEGQEKLRKILREAQ